MSADDDERKEWDYVKTAALEAIRPEVTPDIAHFKPAPNVTQRLADGEASASEFMAAMGDKMAMWQTEATLAPWQYAQKFLERWGHDYGRCDKDQLEDALEEYFAFLEMEDIIPSGIWDMVPERRYHLRRLLRGFADR